MLIDFFTLYRALQYAEANWRGHLDRGNSRRLLSYIYFVAVRDGYPPASCKVHDQLHCNDYCKVIRVSQCVEVCVRQRNMTLDSLAIVFQRARRIVALGDDTEPFSSGSAAFSEYLRFFKEIIDVKYMNEPQFSR